MEPEKRHVLITGAGGFLGQALAAALLRDSSVHRLVLTDISAPSIPNTEPHVKDADRVQSVAADLTSSPDCERLFTEDVTYFYLLHGIMSATAEADLDLGFRVNVDSMRNICDVLRRQKRSRPPVVIYPSSLAVFGRVRPGAAVTELTPLLPQSSYGAQKAMVEMLLNDLSRRDLLDARILRLPTIIVRPGKPSGAASSFCSGIVREPLNGKTAVLPVDSDLELWVCSARIVVQNLVKAMYIFSELFGYGSRCVNLPGQTVTVQEILDALEEVGGLEITNLIQRIPNGQIRAIVGTWPASLNTSRANELGYDQDVSLQEAIKAYIADHLPSDRAQDQGTTAN